MTLKDAYEIGRWKGAEFAVYNLENYPQGVDLETLTEICLQAEENARQFSPFEFFAKECNESKNPDRTWEEYERGLSVGIKEQFNRTTGKA